MIDYITVYWKEILIAILSGFAYLMFNELEDESVRSTWSKFKQFLNSNLSSTNKWKLDKDGKKIPIIGKKWYYLWAWTPKYKERFYLSSTILVFTTDGEHLFQFFKNRFITCIGFIIGWQFVVFIQLGLFLGSLTKELIKKIS